MALSICLTLALLVGASGVSVAESDCEGTKCEGASDSNVLFQRQVVVAPSDDIDSAILEVMRDPLDLKGTSVQALQSEVEDMAKADKRPKMKKMSTIKDMIAKEMMPDLVSTHKTAQAQLHTLSKAVSTCGKNAGKSLTTLKTGAEVTVGNDRKSHSGCRTTEASFNKTKITECTKLSTFLTGIAVPAVLPTSNDPGVMGPYLKAMGEYFCPKHGKFAVLDKKCTTANTAYTTKRTACNKLQTRFEVDFCSWKTKLTDTCAASSTCYKAAVKAYRSAETSTRVLEKKWKIEYTGMKKILCYLSVWLGNNDVGTVDHKTLSGCNASSIDTSPMDVKYPGVPCQISCDTQPVAKSPGTNGFLGEYSNFTQTYDDVIGCMKEGTGGLQLFEDSEEDPDVDEALEELDAEIDNELDDNDDDLDDETLAELDEEEDEDDDKEGLDDADDAEVDEFLEEDAVEEENDGSVHSDIKDKAPSTKFPCSTHPEAVQVIRNKKKTGYDVQALNVNSGNYKNIYSIPKNRSSPRFKALNACGINPKDSILYCIVKIQKNSFLTRLDQHRMIFVHKVFSGKKSSSNSGGFDMDGTFYYNQITRIGRGKKTNTLFALQNVDKLVGHSNQKTLTGLPPRLLLAAPAEGGPVPSPSVSSQLLETPSPSPESTFTFTPREPAVPKPPAKISLNGLPLTGDFVPIKANFEKTGEAKYVLGVVKGGRLLVVRVDAPHKKWLLKSHGHATAKGVHFYGAGWNFQGRVFFANNNGHGVYEVKLATVDLKKKVVEVQRSCKSAKARSNDGVNCLNAAPPFKEPEPVAKEEEPKAAQHSSMKTIDEPTGKCFKEKY